MTMTTFLLIAAGVFVLGLGYGWFALANVRKNIGRARRLWRFARRLDDRLEGGKAARR